MIKWKLEIRKIKDLKNHPKNPRQMDKEAAMQLQSSLERFGLVDKPIINTDNTIIGGHQRINILKKIKTKEIECWVPENELSEAEIDELNIRLNKNHGEWDWDILANSWDVDQLIDYGFTVNELVGDVQDITTPEEDNEILEPGKDEDAVTKSGDIYELVSMDKVHRILCGDSTDPDCVNRVMDNQSPILMVTDPPFGVDYDPSWRDPSNIGSDGIRVSVKSKGKVQNDDQSNWALAYSLFPGSIAYVWCASWFLPEVSKDLKDSEYELKSLIVWVKQHFALSRGDYHWQHEPCWYAVRKGHNHNWQGARDQSTTWEISSMSAFGRSNNEDTRTNHSTQKPLECMARPIRNNTAKGEGVYDPFLGSGTTLIAAEQLGRICYGIEISAAYCDIIVNRYKNYMTKNGLPYTIKRNGINIDG